MEGEEPWRSCGGISVALATDPEVRRGGSSAVLPAGAPLRRKMDMILLRYSIPQVCAALSQCHYILVEFFHAYPMNTKWFASFEVNAIATDVRNEKVFTQLDLGLSSSKEVWGVLNGTEFIKPVP